jgi:cardiolipin synthase
MSHNTFTMFEIPWLALFIASYVVWVVLACMSLLMNRRSPTATLAWIFAFIALPVASGVYYLMFGPRRLQRRKRRYGVARTMAGSVSSHLRGSSCETKPDLSADARGLARVGKRLAMGEPTLALEVQLFDHGDEKLAALEKAFLEAKHHIHLEYYIWEPDRVGQHFRDLLAAAAGRGVEVRVLYDWMGSPRMNDAFWKALVDAGGEVRPFNRLRFSVANIHLGNFRTHRKIAICDGLVGFLGGMNLHDPASATRSGKDAWRDQHVRIVGEPVRKLQRLFLENWTYSGGVFRVSNRSLPAYFPPAPGCGADAYPVQIIASGPDDETAPMHAYFLAAMATARKRIWIETPYLIPDEPFESALRVAELRGIDVQVIVPKEGDSRLVTMASKTYCEALGKAGIAIHEYGPPMMHAKTMIIDETVAIVGTANLDNRSFRLNFEVAAAFYDARIVKHLERRFEEDRRGARTFSAKRRNPMVTQLLESIARLTSPVL